MQKLTYGNYRLAFMVDKQLVYKSKLMATIVILNNC